MSVITGHPSVPLDMLGVTYGQLQSAQIIQLNNTTVQITGGAGYIATGTGITYTIDSDNAGRQMPMLGFSKRLAALPIALCAYFTVPALAAHAAEDAPLGAWRTTNACFLALIYLSADGDAQTAYLSGEHEDEAAWGWDGTTLTITSPTFPQDSFTAQLADGGLAADYVWHDLDTDAFHTETCLFEKVTESEISASL